MTLRSLMFSLLRNTITRWHLLFFACQFLDGLCDRLIGGNWVMFVSETLGADDFFPLFAASLLPIAVAAYGAAVAMRWQDEWPQQGPLLSVAICRLAAAVITTIMALVAGLASASGQAHAYVVCTLLFAIGYAATDAFDSMAFFLAIKRLAGPSDNLLLLFSAIAYVVSNLGAVTSGLITAAVRGLFEPVYSRANVALFGVAAVLMFVTALLARILYLHWRLDQRMWAAPLEKQHYVASEFWGYASFTLALQGILMAYLQFDLTLPKYMRRLFDEGTRYPLIQALNPFLVLFLTPIVLVLPLPIDQPLLIFAGATAWQFLSFLWLLAFPTAAWAVLVGIISITLGEVVWMPRVNAYLATILDDGKVGYYTGLFALPLAVLQSLQRLASYPLLAAYCPGTGDCVATLWAWVAGAAAVTPLALLGLHLWQRRLGPVHI